jgi:hypothetical protein
MVVRWGAMMDEDEKKEQAPVMKPLPVTFNTRNLPQTRVYSWPITLDRRQGHPSPHHSAPRLYDWTRCLVIQEYISRL